MRVLQISADRSKRGILYPNSPAVERQKAYGEHFDALDIIAFSLGNDGQFQFSPSSKVHIYPTRSLSPLFYGLGALRLTCKIKKFDVVSVQDPFETGLAGWLVAFFFRKPLHVQVHTDFLSIGYRRHSITNRIRVMIAGFVLKRAVRIRVVSSRIKDSIITKYHLQQSITTLPIFVDIERFRHALSHPAIATRFSRFTTIILVVSRLEPEKNVALAVDSFAQTALPAVAEAMAGKQDACLIVVGEGSERRALERLAQRSDKSGQIFFEGEHDPAPYYALASLVLVPSRYEGYGMTIVEALAAHKPVIAIDVGVAREAGAIIAKEKEFPKALEKWFAEGPREGILQSYPYENFEAYTKAYADDITACIKIQ